MPKKSNCFKKYGKEWSAELTQATRDHFETTFSGYLKHIAGKGSRYAVDCTFFSKMKYAGLIPEEEMDKHIFLFTFTKFEILKDPEGLAFDVAYDSVDEMIDDGWAVD